MSEMQQRLESFLVADCGNTTTKAVLLDVVEGQYRFVAYAEAPSTIHKPWEDVSVGVIDAIHQLEKTTERTFLDRGNSLITPERGDGQGVDRFLAVSSAAEPLRVVLAGLVRQVSLESARRAALSTYTTIVDVISLEQDPEQEQPQDDDAKINAIWHASPDVICVVGGTDGGATFPVLEMVRNVIRIALYLMGEAAPPVIYAGNANLRESVVKTIEGLAPVRAVENVCPLPDTENIGPLHEEMEVLFYEQKIADLPGIDVLRSWGPAVVLPTARSADYTIRFCEQAYKSSKTALGVDIGSANVTLCVCRDAQPLTTIRTDLGVGYGLMGLLEQVELRDIMRWLPFEISELEVYDRLRNKALRPHCIPQTREDLLLEQAAAREALRLTLQDSLPSWSGRFDARAGMVPPCEPIVASGSVLTHAPYHGHAALILLDALQPVGISTLYLDEYNLVPSLGTVGTVEPLAMVQVLRNEGLTYLGTVVVPVGYTKPGETVLTVKPVDGPMSVSAHVKWGNLEAIPFQFFEPGKMLELIPARGFDIGHGPGKSLTIQYREGTVGLIVDARGRPLVVDADPQLQRRRMDYWLWEMMSS